MDNDLKAPTALTDIMNNGYQECFQKLYECWQKCITAQENYSEGNVV
jgi:hypothetical protein